MITTMKKLAIYTLGLLLAAASTSCSSGGGGESLVEATFTTTVSRADVLTDLADESQMMIYRNTENSISKGSPVASQLVNSGGVWKGVPALKLNPNETSYFWAAYPFNTLATDPTAYPIAVADQVDVLYSGNYVSATYEKPEAALKMRHAMAIMTFNIDSYVTGTLQSITVEGADFPIEGTMRVASGKITTTKYGSVSQTCNVALGASSSAPSLFVIPVGNTLKEPVKVTFAVSGKTYSCTLPTDAMPALNNTQYVYPLTLTEQGIQLHADRITEEDLDVETVAPEKTDYYGVLKVVHSNASYTAPTFAGTNFSGFVYWGDGQSSPLGESVSYVYQSAAPYTVAFDLWNATSVQFDDLVGIEEIDFTKF